ncbi:MAG: type II toxin-antitoxin system HicB family antitoxin [Chitinispirillales bacterium]|jgi:predicted RNase H-like HicB family nuclease|nr:type II toxin-antitoxin system HicB family antitoxin [Chitinispirillales bacterium]
MSYHITAVIQQEENWYVAKCLENGVASQGKSLDEALSNLKEALELYFEDNAETSPMKQTFVTTMEIAL